MFEAEDRPGGHTWTVDVERAAAWSRRHRLPRLQRPQLPRLRGAARPARRRDAAVGHELLGQRRGATSSTRRAARAVRAPLDLVRPSFQRMVGDLLPLQPRGAGADRLTATGPTLRDFLAGAATRAVRRAADRPPGVRGLVGRPARSSGASRPLPRRVLRQPRDARLQRAAAWRTVSGGSRRYVERLTAPGRGRLRLRDAGGRDRARADGVEVDAAGGGPERFDEVILACHSDQALAMLADPSAAEGELLGAIPYQPQRGRPAHRRVADAAAPARLGELELPPQRPRRRAGPR